MIQIVDQANDLLNAFAAYKWEQNEDRKKALGEKLFNETVPANVKFFENLLAKNNSDYFVSNELTWADIVVFNGLEYFGARKDEFLEHAPLLKALDERVKSVPKIAEWLEKRPVTEF